MKSQYLLATFSIFIKCKHIVVLMTEKQCCTKQNIPIIASTLTLCDIRDAFPLGNVKNLE